VQSSDRGSLGSPVPSFSRVTAWTDPNTVVLERFEDASPAAHQQQSQLISSPRRSSFPEGLQHLSISTSVPPHVKPAMARPAAIAQAPPADEYLVRHFRRYITRRLVQPLLDDPSQETITPGATKDLFEVEAARFLPVSQNLLSIELGSHVDVLSSFITLYVPFPRFISLTAAVCRWRKRCNTITRLCRPPQRRPRRTI